MKKHLRLPAHKSRVQLVVAPLASARIGRPELIMRCLCSMQDALSVLKEATTCHDSRQHPP